MKPRYSEGSPRRLDNSFLIEYTVTDKDPSPSPFFSFTLIIRCRPKALLIALTTAQDDGL